MGLSGSPLCPYLAQHSYHDLNPTYTVTTRGHNRYMKWMNRYISKKVIDQITDHTTQSQQVNEGTSTPRRRDTSSPCFFKSLTVKMYRCIRFHFPPATSSRLVPIFFPNLLLGSLSSPLTHLGCDCSLTQQKLLYLYPIQRKEFGCQRDVKNQSLLPILLIGIYGRHQASTKIPLKFCVR